ncbi:MAG: biotin transporter BioY [Bacillota bacterium]|nr:biotin transporter BioY [Bacillota bacterium]
MAQKKRFSTLDISYIGLFILFLSLCAWIAIPSLPPFTLQSMAVLLCGALLGLRRGLLAILLYLLLGLLGLPLFSNFQSAPAVLAGPSGGFLIGFFFSAFFAALGARSGKEVPLLLGMLVGTLFSYVFGLLWFALVYAPGPGTAPWLSGLSICVLPFILPDLAKLYLAFLLVKRLRPIMERAWQR